MNTAESRTGTGAYLSKGECARLFESEHMGVLHLRPRDATIVKINPYLTEILNYDTRELKGKRLASLAALPDETASHDQVQHLLDDGYLRFDDLPLLSRDGICARFSLRSVGIAESDGTAVVECILHDLTSRKERADQHIESGDEFMGQSTYRREFTLNAEREFERARRYGVPLSLLSIEIDRRMGDTEHQDNRIGDLSLRTFAESCAAVLRRSDSVGRVGESRFVALLPESDATEAATAAEHLRTAIETLDLATKLGGSTRVTVSIGVATDGASYEEMLASASEMLKVARLGGGNCIATSRLALH